MNAELKHQLYLLESTRKERDGLEATVTDLVAARDAVEEAVRQVMEENTALVKELRELKTNNSHH